LKRTVPHIFLVSAIILSSLAYAASAVFNPLYTIMSPVSPPVYYVGPEHNVVYNLVLSSRNAVNYTDFEAAPGWDSLSGSWSWPAQGYSGKGFSGTGNPAVASPSTTLSGGTWYVSCKVYHVPSDGYSRGIVLYESSSRMYFLVAAGNNIEIWRLKKTWTRIAFTAFNPQGAGWFILNATYTPATGSLYLEVYSISGSRLASVSTSDSGVSPSRVGLGVRGAAAATGLFDDFIASYSRNGVVGVSELSSGWTTILYDSTGNPVASASAGASGAVELNVRLKPEVRDGTIAVKDSLGNTVCSKTFKQVLGGDSFTLHSYKVFDESIGSNRTSASCNVYSTGALHVYDYDLSGSIVVSKSLNYRMGSNNYVSVGCYAHVFNLTDPQSLGVVVAEVQILNGASNAWFSFYYYGGSSVKAGSASVSLNMNLPHSYTITLYLNGSRLGVEYWIDNVKVNSESYTVSSLTVAGINVGRYAVGNMYDLYLDMASCEAGAWNLQPSYDDFDDGVDNFFTSTTSSGNAGKTVTGYIFPTLFLEAYDVDKTYYARLLTLSFTVVGQPTVSVWMSNGTSYSSQVKVVNGNLLSPSTSEIQLRRSGVLEMYVNGTIPQSSSITLNLEFSYRLDSQVTVRYPQTLKVTG